MFDNILSKAKLEGTDLELIIQKIVVYRDRLDIQLYADVKSLLSYGLFPEKTSG